MSVLGTMYEMECSVQLEDPFVGFTRAEGGGLVVQAIYLTRTGGDSGARSFADVRRTHTYILCYQRRRKT